MWIGIVSLFPEMFSAITEQGITGRAVQKGLLELAFWNPREFAHDRHRTVDDKPYGGGPGMLMKVPPLRDAIQAARSAAQARGSHEHENENENEIKNKCRVVYLSPQGRRLDQATLNRLASEDSLVLVAGRYEGVDERLIDTDIDEEISIGDYVVSGGELPAMVLIDGVTRLLPGAVGDSESVTRDSFFDGLLNYPQYTRPESIDGRLVPPVLMSGNHAEISRWRLKQSLGRTLERRPDLLEERELTKTERELLEAYRKEHDLP